MSAERDVSGLVANAAHGSVSEESLTELTSDDTRLLHTYPLVEYLRAGEQPHFILTGPGESLSIEGPDAVAPPENDGTGATMHMVTDQWWLTVTANQAEDQWMGVPLPDLTGVSVGKRSDGTYEVSLSTETYGVVARVSNDYGAATVNDLRSWLLEHSPATGTYRRSWDGETAAQTQNDTGTASESAGGTPTNAAGAGPHMNAEPRGNWVTPKRVAKMGDTLDPDENVHYMFKGTTIDVEGSTSGTSLFGNDRDRKSAIRGIYTAVTDKRVVINIPQFTGDDERHVPYSSIVSCDIDTGLVAKRLSLQTKGPTYHIEVNAPGKDELREAARFVRDKAEEANKTVVQSTESEPDPTEQLKNVKELHEQGVLTDAEFEEKKQALLDKI
jgi:hypothetical protein